MEGLSDTPHLEPAELWAIFDQAQRGRTGKATLEAVNKVSRRSRNLKTVNGALEVAKVLLIMDLDAVRKLDRGRASEIAEGLRYDVTPARVLRLRTEFLIWKQATQATAEERADQQTVRDHQKDLVKMADRLRYNMTMPGPRKALFDMASTPSSSLFFNSAFAFRDVTTEPTSQTVY